jgi:hypothetical protein
MFSRHATVDASEPREHPAASTRAQRQAVTYRSPGATTDELGHTREERIIEPASRVANSGNARPTSAPNRGLRRGVVEYAAERQPASPATRAGVAENAKNRARTHPAPRQQQRHGK